jgi:hypothetical protein
MTTSEVGAIFAAGVAITLYAGISIAGLFVLWGIIKTAYKEMKRQWLLSRDRELPYSLKGE